MGNKVRKFGFAGDAPPKGRSPIPIQLNDKVFHIRGQIAGIRLLHIMRALDGDLTEGENAGTVLWDFLEYVFTKDCKEEALAYLKDADPPISFTEVMEIVSWMIKEYTGNPTEQPEQSEHGSSTNGSGASESTSSEESTSETSTHTNSSPQEPISLGAQ